MAGKVAVLVMVVVRDRLMEGERVCDGGVVEEVCMVGGVVVVGRSGCPSTLCRRSVILRSHVFIVISGYNRCLLSRSFHL